MHALEGQDCLIPGCGLVPVAQHQDENEPIQQTQRGEHIISSLLGQQRVIEPANKIHILWKAIVDNEIIKEGKDNRVWKLANGVKWLDDMDILYNRAIYDKLLAEMKGKKLVLICGSPGIGKSIFLQRLLVEIVEEAHKARVEIPSIVLAMREGRNVMKFWLNPDGTVETFDIGIQRKDPDYYLSDNVDADTILGFKLHIEVTSSSDPTYNQFAQKVAVHAMGLDTNMTVWSLEELSAIRGDISLEEAKLRHWIVGGSARNFRRRLPIKGETLGVIESVLSWALSGTDYQTRFRDTFDGYCRLLSQELHNVNGGVTFMNHFMRHLFCEQSQWASKIMEIIGAELWRHRNVNVYEELQKLLTPVGIGSFYQSLVHRTLTRPGATCTLKPLPKRCGPNVHRKAETTIRLDYPIVLLHTIKDIETLEEERYGLPLFETDSAVDAVVQPNILIHITVGPNSHPDVDDKWKEFRAKLKEKDPAKHKMIFVVPQRHAKAFKFQDPFQDIAQFMTTETEVSSELCLLSESHGRASKKAKTIK